MYLRFTSRTNADGSVVRYVALAHNRRVDGQTKPDVLMNLGRVDQLDVDGLRRLAASINKHFGDVDLLSDAAEAGAVVGAAPLEVPAQRHDQHDRLTANCGTRGRHACVRLSTQRKLPVSPRRQSDSTWSNRSLPRGALGGSSTTCR
jgi:hypothetical protein